VIVTTLCDLVQVIHDADPADKAELYSQLGLSMTYRSQERLVEATVTPSLHMRKGFGFAPRPPARSPAAARQPAS
jgi:hypothetical protein